MSNDHKFFALDVNNGQQVQPPWPLVWGILTLSISGSMIPSRKSRAWYQDLLASPSVGSEWQITSYESASSLVLQSDQ